MTRKMLWFSVVFLIGVLFLGVSSAGDLKPTDKAPTIYLPDPALTAADLALIVNRWDPTSRGIAEYYRKARSIPSENIISVSFPLGISVMQPQVFNRIYQEVLDKTPNNVQAYALTWAAPYRVGCMSITTAFAAGYNQDFCAHGCKPIRKSPYFASSSRHPLSDYNLRPAMMLAGLNEQAVKALIDRGVSADNTRPGGTGYLVTTSDQHRSVRAGFYPAVISALSSAVKLVAVNADFLEEKPDILFYLTGLVEVPKITTNQFLPGAIADHLTSTGGQLTDSRQMSALRWLEAGATGSYGAVVEPCNLTGKFPHPGILISRYLAGETLIEAYWKSVEMPGQGVFIGEPLARPFGGYEISRRGDRWLLKTYSLSLGSYWVEAADSPIGPYRTIGRFNKVDYSPVVAQLPMDVGHFVRIVAATETP